MKHAKNDNIRATLNKLRTDANAKELELIDLVASIYEAVKEKREEAKEAVRDTAQNLNTSVHLHPWYYISGAALIGFLTGFILRR